MNTKWRTLSLSQLQRYKSSSTLSADTQLTRYMRDAARYFVCALNAGFQPHTVALSHNLLLKLPLTTNEGLQEACEQVCQATLPSGSLVKIPAKADWKRQVSQLQESWTQTADICLKLCKQRKITGTELLASFRYKELLYHSESVALSHFHKHPAFQAACKMFFIHKAVVRGEVISEFKFSEYSAFEMMRAVQSAQDEMLDLGDDLLHSLVAVQL